MCDYFMVSQSICWMFAFSLLLVERFFSCDIVSLHSIFLLTYKNSCDTAGTVNMQNEWGGGGGHSHQTGFKSDEAG